MLVRFSLLVVVVLAVPATAQEPAPRTIAFQGVLEEGGTPVTASTSTLFRLFDAATGGTKWWEETQTVTPDASGTFSVRLGSVTALDSAFAQPLWLEVSPEGAVIGPRTPLDAVPYALGVYGLRVIPPLDPGDAPNIVAGSPINRATGAIGATISGGGVNVGLGNLLGPNRVTANYGTIGGGIGLTVSGEYGTAGGGFANRASALFTTVSGGGRNAATGQYAAVGGGEDNTASGESATIAGGTDNEATAETAIVSGGRQNTASGFAAVVAGGANNSASATSSVIGGGQGNGAGGAFATIPGGIGNVANGSASFAAGQNASTSHAGTFVWSGVSAAFASTAPSQFLIDAPGGVGLMENAPLAQLHLETQDIGLTGAALENDEVVVEAGDAVVGLYSTSAGLWGSALALAQVNATGAVANKWGIARQTSAGTNALHFTFGVTANYAGNDTQMRIDPDGSVHADGSFVGGGADLAEFFPLDAGATVEAGHVVGLRGGRVSLSTHDAEQVAVVSSDPAFIGNPDAEAGGALVALVGQVAVRLGGQAAAGDLLVASGRSDGTALGVAPSAYRVEADGPVIGRVLRVDGQTAIALVGVDEAAALRAVVADQQSQIDALLSRLEAVEARLTGAAVATR